jgi:hypothetical protein
MSGSNKGDKKSKAEREAFKKAFKKQTGIASDEKNVGKLVGAFTQQVKELTKWTVILTKIQPEEMDAGRGRLVYWVEKAKALEAAAKKDPKWAGSTVRDQLPVLLKVVEAVRKKAKSKPVKQDVGGREVSVYITDIPGYADMATNERQEAVRLAAEKTARGLQLYDQISSGALDVDNPDRVTRPGEAEALVWALKSKAQEKLKGPYQKGAMTVPNGEKLRKYLDKCPEVYSRLSSHLREQQGRNVKDGASVESKEGQTPRGVDFYNPGGDDKPGSLPAGMNALLYQQVVLPNGEVALYVKMETQGSYGHPGDNRKLDSTVPPDRRKHPNDGARALKHLKNLLIKEKGDDSDLAGTREKTPKEVIDAIKAVVKAVEGKKAQAYLKSSYGTEPKWVVLQKAVPRISLFISAVEDCRAHAGEPGWQLGDKAEDLLDRLGAILQSKIPADLLEADRRMGEEVVVTDRGMAGVEEEPEAEDDLSLDDDGGFDKADVVMWCSDLVDAVLDPDLKKQLQTIYYGEVVEKQDSDAFRHFSKVLDKATPEKLGPRASKLADRLTDELERL